MFDILEQKVAKFCKNGQTILMGDFNARTSTVDDVVTSINPGIIPEADINSFDVNCVSRRSPNCISSCTYGKQLIDLCISSGLKIANGRLFDDSNGQFTCHKYNSHKITAIVHP